MAYKPPKLQTDERGRWYITKTINGRRYRKRFGQADTPQAIAAWEAFLDDYRHGRVDWHQDGTSAPSARTSAPSAPAAVAPAATDASIAAAVVAYLREFDYKQISDGEKAQTHRVLEIVARRHGREPADSFRAKKLKSLRRHFCLDLGWNHKHAADGERRVRNWIRWCVTEELVSYQTAWLIDQVPRLQPGELGTTRKTARPPVELADFEAVLPHLPPSVADFARVQFLCGMRPGEVARLRAWHATGDATLPGGEAPVWLHSAEHDVWLYRFDAHKTRWKTDSPLWKAVPQLALDILERHQDREAELTGGTGWLLRPSVVKAERAAARGPRKTKPTLRNRLQRVRVAEAYDAEADHYSYDQKHPSRGYSQVIRTAVKKAIDAGDLTAAWSPNQLRHGMATFLAQADGLQSAQVYLGHADSRTTRTYYAPESTPELARVARVVQDHAAAWLN